MAQKVWHNQATQARFGLKERHKQSNSSRSNPWARGDLGFKWTYISPWQHLYSKSTCMFCGHMTCTAMATVSVDFFCEPGWKSSDSIQEVDNNFQGVPSGHQPHGWLENPRTEWRFLARISSPINGRFSASHVWFTGCIMAYHCWFQGQTYPSTTSTAINSHEQPWTSMNPSQAWVPKPEIITNHHHPATFGARL